MPSSPSLILSETAPSSQRSRIGEWLVLGGAALAYSPFIFLGYGADIDSYAVVRVAERMADGGGYIPSRPPGYPLYEVATSVLNGIGGAVLTNVSTLVMALVALASFFALCRRFDVPNRVLLGLLFALHPFVWTNAASTMDYLWALAFGLAGGVALMDRRWVVAGLLFALAISTRFTSVLFIAGFFGYVLWRDRPERNGIAGAALIAFALGGLCYLPAILHYGGVSEALTPVGVEAQAEWGWFERIGRFGYKNVYFWGLPATLLLLGLGVRTFWRSRRGQWPKFVASTPVLVFVAILVLVYEGLFLRYPLETAYLLPILPFALIGMGLTVERRWLAGLFVLVLAYNVVSINLARPDLPNRATSATVGVWIEPGPLVTDVARRLRVKGCHDETCWMERSDRGFFPDLFGTEADE